MIPTVAAALGGQSGGWLGVCLPVGLFRRLGGNQEATQGEEQNTQAEVDQSIDIFNRDGNYGLER